MKMSANAENFDQDPLLEKQSNLFLLENISVHKVWNLIPVNVILL